jgi:dTDP-6-deoxy-L-talose 4-dehydrogenase (NAD+)
MAGVLITGASGLIGRRVVEAFQADPPVALVALGRADVDLLVPGAWGRLFDELSPDSVVHLAWSASAKPDYRDHEDNWRWAETTIEAATIAAERGIQFLGTGTSVDIAPGADAYSRSKSAVREALAKRITAGELAWLRPFYVFDEERPSPAVLRAALAAKSSGERVALASPHARHDFVHAIDAGTAIRTAVRARLTGAVDIGSGVLAAVADLVEAYGCEWVAGGAPSPAAGSGSVADVTALLAAGWRPDATNARLRPAD